MKPWREDDWTPKFTFGSAITGLSGLSGLAGASAGMMNNIFVAFYKSGQVGELESMSNGTVVVAGAFTAGTQPSGIAVADFNADGIPDVAVPNSNGVISVMLGNADGTLGAPGTYAIANNSVGVAAGDLNADGVADLVVGGATVGTVSVLLGNGNGTFGAAVTYGAGTGARWPLIADVNGDGVPDIIVPNDQGANGTVSVLLGNANGTFQAQKTYTTGIGPYYAALGDLNGDGIADLAVANSATTTVSILLGNANGTFKAKTDFTTISQPTLVVMADLNADGNLDLAIVSSITGVASVLLGNGNGTFKAQVTYGTGVGPEGLLIADLNGDGIPDMLVSNYTYSTASILLGNGNGTFQAQSTFSTGANTGPQAIAINRLPASLAVTMPATVTAGVSFTFTVTAQDALGKTVTSYTDVVRFSMGGGSSTMPVASALTKGVGTFTATLNTADGNRWAHAFNRDETVPFYYCHYHDINLTTLKGFTSNDGVNFTAVTINYTQAGGTVVIAPRTFIYSGFIWLMHLNGAGGGNNFATTNFGFANSSDGVNFNLVGNGLVTPTINGATKACTNIPQPFVDHHFPVGDYRNIYVLFAWGSTFGDAGDCVMYYMQPTNPQMTAFTTPQPITLAPGFTPNPVADFFMYYDPVTNLYYSFWVKSGNPGTQLCTVGVSSTVTGPHSQLQAQGVLPTMQSINLGTSPDGLYWRFYVDLEDGNIWYRQQLIGAGDWRSGLAPAGIYTFTTIKAQIVGNVGAICPIYQDPTAKLPYKITASGVLPVLGTSPTFTLASQAVTHLTVGTPPLATAGQAFAFYVAGRDTLNNIATSYVGTVHLTTTDTGASTALSANAGLTSGLGTFTATLATVGTQTITATDANTATITGASSGITVAKQDHFVMSGPATATAGANYLYTVFAETAYNTVDTAYAGTVHFTCTDSLATLAANAALVSGQGTFSATVTAAGNQTLTVADANTATITAAAQAITVAGGAAASFTLVGTNTTIGAASPLTVTALDANGNAATSYTGTVTFTSSDSLAKLPPNSTLAAGVGNFSATFFTQGTQTITGTDTVTSSITGVSAGIQIGGIATHFTVTGPTATTAGAVSSYTVKALDLFNNTATAYAGTVTFSAKAAGAGITPNTLPPNSKLSGGVGAFSVTLTAATSQNITAKDVTTASITGATANINVSSSTANHYQFTGTPFSVTSGVAKVFTLQVNDPFNNRATTYAGTINWGSSDPAVVLPTKTTLSAGTGNFTVTMNTAGAQTLTVSDVANVVPFQIGNFTVH